MERTFSKFPDIIQSFADIDFDPSVLNDLSKVPVDDPTWKDDYGLRSKL